MRTATSRRYTIAAADELMRGTKATVTAAIRHKGFPNANLFHDYSSARRCGEVKPNRADDTSLSQEPGTAPSDVFIVHASNIGGRSSRGTVSTSASDARTQLALTGHRTHGCCGAAATVGIRPSTPFAEASLVPVQIEARLALSPRRAH